MKRFFFLLVVMLITLPVIVKAQGLEQIIVEEVQVDLPEVMDGTAKAYRVFVDMEPDWGFSTCYGDANHPLFIKTTTSFWNTPGYSLTRGSQVPLSFEPSFVYDSYISCGLAGMGGVGVTYDEDPQGWVSGSAPSETVLGLDLTALGFGEQSLDITTSSGAWAALVTGGSKGPTATNRVLIGQFTTDGDLSFNFCIQLLDPELNIYQFVPDNPVGDEIQFSGLSFGDVPVQGCTSSTACNYNPEATEDDGSCLEPVDNCSECQGEELVIIDSDGDGICDADEISGCTSPTACNYNENATDDDGSCIEPIDDCMICNETNDGLIMLDIDNDGICDANDDTGCTSSTACNYNPDATIDDGSCLEPVENCTECDGDALKLIDSDGDGICDLDDIEGCTSPTACNYNEFATDDDGSCIEPVEGCSVCDGEELALIDIDNDGICDLDDDTGCTSPTACNYNEYATIDDGTCIEPAENCSECDGSDLVIIDADGDGVCDADEVHGCTIVNACNYDPDATENDGSCIFPVEGCSVCDGDTIALIDEDGDGICDLEEPGIEDVIVEIYYISDEDDAIDTEGGHLPAGSVTYRIYVDMGPNFLLNTIYGDENVGHSLYFRTSTEFFNNESRGGVMGTDIRANRLDENTLGLDSYITIGMASDSHIGVPKADDSDGSIIGGNNNDGGSESIEGGLLKNDLTEAGIPLIQADGLIPGIAPNIVVLPGTESFHSFGDENSGEEIVINSGVWACLEGYKGPAPDNKVLIAQVTTDGEFSFGLNIQVKTDEGETEVYVFENPVGEEILLESLQYISRPGCTSQTACNYDPDATIDNGTCLEPIEFCYECDGDTIRIIDSDGDGICDLEDSNEISDVSGLINTIQVFPNPAQNKFTIEFTNKGPEQSFRFYIIDATGRLMSEDIIEGFKGNWSKTISTYGFGSGLYNIRIVSEDGSGSANKILSIIK